MRITNSMISNGMLLNINRNANSLNKYYNQLSTGKKIQVPSDGPLLASRALRFRTNVSETEQYLKNVAQGASWMEVTEAAFRNVNDILLTIRGLTVRGDTDTLTYEDRNKIITDIASLVEQIGLEMNVTYAGRYVFSGYRTDQPPVLTETSTTLSYNNITQYFDTKDVEYTKAYTRGDLYTGTPASEVQNVAVIKLAYTNLTSPFTMEDPLNPGTFILAEIEDPSNPGTFIPINVVSISDQGAYSVGNYIRETGELVLAVGNPDTPLALVEPPSSIRYNKTGFMKGELNPQIYFHCVDNTPGSDTLGMVFNAGFANGERQHFEFEFSVNTRVRINANAPDVLTDKMYADYQVAVAKLQYINGMTKEQITTAFIQQGLTGEQLEDAVAQEMQMIQRTAQERFSDLLGLVDSHISSVSVEHTDLGSRMRRVELIETRLKDDRIAYTKLLSDNEDADYAEVMIRLAALEGVYQASLKTGSSIMKLTLADYI